MQEAERLELKKRLLNEASRASPPETLICSSTSAFLVLASSGNAARVGFRRQLGAKQ